MLFLQGHKSWKMPSSFSSASFLENNFPPSIFFLINRQSFKTARIRFVLVATVYIYFPDHIYILAFHRFSFYVHIENTIQCISNSTLQFL